MGFLRCKVKRHELAVIATENVQIQKYECLHCKQQFTRDGYGKIVKLDSYWERSHQIFTSYFSKLDTA